MTGLATKTGDQNRFVGIPSQAAAIGLTSITIKVPQTTDTTIEGRALVDNHRVVFLNAEHVAYMDIGKGR
jgi:hypothetical protein